MDESNFLTLFDIIIGIYTIVIFQFLFIVYTLGKSIYQFRIYNKRQDWEEKIDDEIFLYIFNENEMDNPIINEELKSDKFKDYFIKKILHALISFSGNSKDRVIELYYRYKLDQHSIKKLYSKNEYTIAGALQEVTAIGINEALPKILQLSHHPNDLVRNEAQYAMVKFEGIMGLRFLDDYSFNITIWQQIKLLNAIDSIAIDHNQSILQWLQSENESVVILALKLIHKFQLFEFEDYLLKMLNECSTDLKTQIIKTFSAINGLYTGDQLIEYYPYQEDDVQIEILKIIDRIGEPRHHHFLMAEAINHSNLSIKKKAIKALIDLTTIEETIQLLESSPNDENKSILNQIILENT